MKKNREPTTESNIKRIIPNDTAVLSVSIRLKKYTSKKHLKSLDRKSFPLFTPFSKHDIELGGQRAYIYYYKNTNHRLAVCSRFVKKYIFIFNYNYHYNYIILLYCVIFCTLNRYYSEKHDD